MTRVTLVGAAGKMGGRVRGSLRDDPDYELVPVESSAEGRERLAAEGWAVTEPDEAYGAADIVVLAVPDSVVGTVAQDVVPRLDPGAVLVCLDPAGAHAGRLPRREDISCVVTHPTHPPLYSLLEEPDPAARVDYWGGGLARQSIVSALAWGDESDFERAQELSSRIFRPILRAHRVTLEQLALLEPAMAETVAITCVAVMKEALDEVVRRGVPEQAATDFMLGHIQIGVALLFEQLDWRISAGAAQAVEEAMQSVIREDWKRVFEPGEVLASVERITTASAAGA